MEVVGIKLTNFEHCKSVDFVFSETNNGKYKTG